jgi:hypothetical protein
MISINTKYVVIEYISDMTSKSYLSVIAALFKKLKSKVASLESEEKRPLV